MSGSHLVAGSHAAFVVAGVEESVDHMAATLGLEFRSPALVPFEVLDARGVRHRQQVRVAYSTDGRIELIEATAGGPFASADEAGMHHFGGVVADLDAAVAAQRTRGGEVEWELSHEGTPIAVFMRGGGLPGCLELINGQAPPLLDMYSEGR